MVFHCINIPYCIYSPTNGNLGFVQSLSITNIATMSNMAHEPFCMCDSIFAELAHKEPVTKLKNIHVVLMDYLP